MQQEMLMTRETILMEVLLCTYRDAFEPNRTKKIKDLSRLEPPSPVAKSSRPRGPLPNPSWYTLWVSAEARVQASLGFLGL